MEGLKKGDRVKFSQLAKDRGLNKFRARLKGRTDDPTGTVLSGPNKWGAMRVKWDDSPAKKGSGLHKDFLERVKEVES